MAVPTDRKITRADIEGKLQEIKGDVETTSEAAKPVALGVAVAGVIGIVAIAFLLGKRKGKKKTTVVEVRRV
jgi:hypothetical protein